MELPSTASAVENNIDPRNDDKIVDLAQARSDQENAAAAAARGAIGNWSAPATVERSVTILRITDRMKAESTRFSDLEALICSKPISCAR